MKNPKNIVITGASSGLGRALAVHYAKTGMILHLQGRNAVRLEETAKICRSKGAMVHTGLCDVTNGAAVKNWLEKVDKISPVDLVIANAGISAGSGIHGEGEDQLRRIFAVNIDGVVNTIEPLLPKMAARRHGQVAVMSSIAGFRGLPSCPAYSASKMCVRALGEAWRGLYASKGIEVSVICPGYVATPMTERNTFPMPFIMSAEKAARIIAEGLEKNKARIVFPLALYFPLWLLTCLSPALTDWLFSRLPAKPAVSE